MTASSWFSKMSGTVLNRLLTLPRKRSWICAADRSSLVTGRRAANGLTAHGDLIATGLVWLFGSPLTRLGDRGAFFPANGGVVGVPSLIRKRESACISRPKA